MNKNIMEKLNEYRIPLIGIVVVLVIAVVASFGFQKNQIKNNEQLDGTVKQGENNPISEYSPLENRTSVALSDQSKKILEDRIISTQVKIASFSETTPITEKVNYYFALSADQKALGLYKDSEETLLKAIALDPSNGSLHQSYSVLLWVADQDSHARKEINKAIELKPSEFNFWLTKIDYNTGAKTEIMEQIYQNALSATNRDIDIIVRYALFEEEIGNIQKAINLWKEAQTIYPKRLDIYQQEIDRLQKM